MSGLGRILRNAAPLAALESFTLLLALLLVPFLTRTLGPAGFGRYAVGVAAAGVLATIVDYGFNQLGPKEVARAEPAGVARARIYWSIQSAKLLIALCATPLLALAAWALGLYDTYGSVLVITALGAVSALAFPAWFLQGMQRYRTLATCLSLARLSSAAATVAWVREPKDAALAVFLQVMVGPLAGLFTMADAGLRHALPFQRPDLGQSLHWVRAGGPLFGSTAAMSMYTTCVPLILGALTSPTTVGLFSAADKARVVGQTLLSPLTWVAFSTLSRRMHENIKQGLAMARQVMLVQLLLALAGTAAILLFAEPLLRIFAGPQFLPAVPTARILGLCLVFTALANALGAQVMLPLNMDRAFSVILGLAAGAGLVASSVLCPLWLDQGAAAAVLGTEVLIVVMMALYLRHRGVSLLRGTYNGKPPGTG